VADFAFLNPGRMELFIFARFHARPGNEGAVVEALLDVIGATREEADCLSIQAFQSVFIRAEAAFEYHAGLPHTMRFIERVEPLIDSPLEVTRTERIGEDLNAIRRAR
jgi:quinol monooxygenase YgiN